MAKKKAPQRLAGAEESCISPEQEAIIQWFRTVKFRKNLLGGVDEAAMWKKLEELYALYEAAIRAERTRYNVLLEASPSKPDGFATSPDRATTTTAASGGNREELLGQRPAGRECKTLHEADAGSRNPDAGAAQPEASGTGEPGNVNLAPTKVNSFAKGSPTRGAGTATAVTERFNPEFDSSDPQKEAHSDAPAGQ